MRADAVTTVAHGASHVAHIGSPHAHGYPTGVSAPRERPRSLHQGYIAELDGLRGIAILLVIVHHFWPDTGPLVVANDVVHLGWIGVDLFFVISGFLITGILLDTRGEAHYFRNYLARRALRVFPLYYLLVIGAFVVIPWVQPGSFWDTELVQESGSPLWYLLYAGNIREAITGVEPAYILAPLWSLSIEEQFYLSFPFVVALLERRTLARVLVGMVIFAPVFRTVMLVLVPDNERIQYLATASRVDVLALGALLAVAVRSPIELPSRRTTGRAFLALFAVFVVAFAAGGLDRHTAFCRIGGYTLVAFMFLAAVTWTIQSRGARSTAWLRTRPLQYLGKICYGVYLLQRPAEVVLVRLLDATGLRIPPESFALVIAKMLFAFGVASASWYVLERPILKLKDRFTLKNHPARPAARITAELAASPPGRSRRRLLARTTLGLAAFGIALLVSEGCRSAEAGRSVVAVGRHLAAEGPEQVREVPDREQDGRDPPHEPEQQPAGLVRRVDDVEVERRAHRGRQDQRVQRASAQAEQPGDHDGGREEPAQLPARIAHE